MIDSPEPALVSKFCKAREGSEKANCKSALVRFLPLRFRNPLRRNVEFTFEGRDESSVNTRFFEKLEGLKDPAQLKVAVADLCSPYGEVKWVDVFPVGNEGFVCLVQLSSRGQNAALCSALGGFLFGWSVGFRIPGRLDS